MGGELADLNMLLKCFIEAAYFKSSMSNNATVKAGSQVRLMAAVKIAPPK